MPAETVYEQHEHRSTATEAALAMQIARQAMQRINDHEATCASRWAWLVGIMVTGMGTTIGMLITLLMRHV
jgi:rhamnogalacturonyl hydrolase YesR